MTDHALPHPAGLTTSRAGRQADTADRLTARGWSHLAPDEQRLARFLVALSVVSGSCDVVGIIFSSHVPVPEVGAVVRPTLLGAGLCMLVVFALARAGRLRLASGVAVATHWLTTIVIQLALWGVTPENGQASMWMMLPLLVTSALVSVRWMAALAAVGVAFAALHSLQFEGLARQQAIDVVVLIGMVGALIVVFSRHRDRVERDRASILQSRNTELESLRASLEMRVQQRTAEVAASHSALESAYESLRHNQQSMVLVEKMASLGRLTAGIAHEMNSPLAAVRAAVSLTQKLVSEYESSIDDPTVGKEDHHAIAREMAEILSLADSGAERATQFVRGIKAQTRDDGRSERVALDVVATVKDAMRLIGHAAIAERVALLTDYRVDRAEITGRSGRIEQVVTNLVRNAIDAAAERKGGSVRVVVDRDTDGLVLTVDDDGPGIAPENLSKIFDPLFTTKPIGKGTGLGLTIVHDLVHGELGGSIAVDSKPGVGTTFTVRIPLHTGA